MTDKEIIPYKNILAKRQKLRELASECDLSMKVEVGEEGYIFFTSRHDDNGDIVLSLSEQSLRLTEKNLLDLRDKLNLLFPMTGKEICLNDSGIKPGLENPPHS